MSNFNEGKANYTLASDERILMITRIQAKEIFRWSSKVKETKPLARSQGDRIIDLIQKNLSPMNPKPFPVVLKTEEINTLIWWQELSKEEGPLTTEVLTLLKNCRDKIKPPEENKDPESK